LPENGGQRIGKSLWIGSARHERIIITVDYFWGMVSAATLYPAQNGYFNLNAQCLSGDKQG
jgi:hypothetical protein